MSKTKSITDFIVHSDHKAYDRSFRNKNGSKCRDSSCSDNPLVDVPAIQKNTREYETMRLPGVSYEWPDMHIAGNPPLLPSTLTMSTPPKSPSPKMIMPCVSQRSGRDRSNSGNNPSDGLAEVDLQRCTYDILLENENKVSQEDTVDHTMEFLDHVVAPWSLSRTPPVEQPRPSRVQHVIKNSVAHIHAYRTTVQATMMHRRTVSFVEPLSEPFEESQKKRVSCTQMAPALKLYWYEQSVRTGPGPPHRPPVEAKTVTITTMAQFDLLKKAMLSSNVVTLSIKEDGTTSAMSTRHQPHFYYCVLQVVCSSEPHTVFKLEMHRLDHDASSRKEIFKGYDAATIKFITPGSSTARLLSAHLIVLLQELLKNPSIAKVSYNWRNFLSSANKTLACAIGSTSDHKNMVDLRYVGLIFRKTKSYVTTPSSSFTTLCKNQGENHGVVDDDDDNKDSDDREANRWLPDPPRAKTATEDSRGNSARLQMTTRGQTALATPDVTLSAWTLRPGVARTFYGHPNIIFLLAKITGKRIGTTNWIEESNLPYMTPIFRSKCQYADERALLVLEVFFLLQNVRQLKG
ncbi:hypothetical protein BGZ81_008022 [Podila clonocystis]|nr:hypothetical protein BGZ81_008022 [Podila clonocystis]